MDQIAGSAGVAVGTLYRRFPTKTDLVAAVVNEFVTQVADRCELAATRVVQGGAAFVELAALVRDIVAATAANQAAKAAAGTLNAVANVPDDVHRAGVALQSLIEAARAEKTVRADLSIEDFYLLVANVPADQPPAALERWVDLALFGIAGPGPQ